MVQSYSRYEPETAFGVIAAPNCNIVHDFSGNLAFTGALQSVAVWNLRQAAQIGSLAAANPHYPYVLSGEACVLCKSTDKTTIATGYTNGDVRIFNFLSKAVVATLRAHRSPVVSLVYNRDSTLLASGGSDSDILIWDITTLTAVCRLRGHKDTVTGVAFIDRGPQQLLLSVSKDTLLKVWDLTTQFCVQTIVGHRTEVWALAVGPPNSRGNVMVLTGSADNLVRGYRLAASSSSGSKEGSSSSGGSNDPLLGDDETVLEYYGSFERGSSSSSDRCVGVHFSADGSLVALQSSLRAVEILRVRSTDEAKKKHRRRLKRLREKDNNNSGNSVGSSRPLLQGPGAEEPPPTRYSSWAEDEPGDPESGAAIPRQDRELQDSPSEVLSDELEFYCSLKLAGKVRGFSFNPIVSKDGQQRFVVSLASNVLESYQVASPSRPGYPSPAAAAKTAIIELNGHRSDVRGVALSPDAKVVAACTAEGVVFWSTSSGLCLRTSRGGDGLAVSFVPGGRYVVVGTREGRVQVVDAASAETVVDVEGHSGPVWSLAVRPDGQGLMTGAADKQVKFWDFSVVGGKMAVQLVRELAMPSDVLCVGYSANGAPDKLLLAIGLLDNTIKLFFDDSLKFFLSLYGHKLPVMCLDVSSDSKLLATGSADKTVKLWGLDFGDCHRSLLAHEDSVQSVRFQADSHLFFSGGRDGCIKYWDGDRFELILLLPGHVSSVWGLCCSTDGALLASGGRDRTVRLWARSEDLVFVEEEKERALDALVDRSAAEEEGAGAAREMVPGARSAESLRGSELLAQALVLVDEELAALAGEQRRRQEGLKVAARRANPLLLSLPPYKYLVRCLRLIKEPDLEQALIVLSFHEVTRLVSLLVETARRGLDLELCAKCSVFLLRCHQSQVVASRSLLGEMLALQEVLQTSVDSYRSLVGGNCAGLRFMRQMIDEKSIVFGQDGDGGDGSKSDQSQDVNKKKKKKAKTTK